MSTLLYFDSWNIFIVDIYIIITRIKHFISFCKSYSDVIITASLSEDYSTVSVVQLILCPQDWAPQLQAFIIQSLEDAA